ncbi:hypothetical protein ACPVPU_09970 [Sphingomonas sp. CJ99]
MLPHLPRPFQNDQAVRTLGRHFLTQRLAKAEWTHEAHLAVTLWAIEERADLIPERDFPQLIRDFNVSVGGVNNDRQGYHDTITQCFIVGVRAFLAGQRDALALVDRVNRLLLSDQGQRDWPLRFYSPSRLFSVDARRKFIAPDLAPLPVVN